MGKSFLFNKDYNINNINNINNLNKIKSHNDSESGLPSIVPLVSLVLLFPNASVSNSMNYANPKPKQQIIQNVQEKGDVNMSKDKETSTQEVRQKDLDSLEELFDQKLRTVNEHIDGKFNLLNQKIEETQKDIDKEADRRYRRTNWTIAIVGIVVPIVIQIVFKLIK